MLLKAKEKEAANYILQNPEFHVKGTVLQFITIIYTVPSELLSGISVQTHSRVAGRSILTDAMKELVLRENVETFSLL